MPSLFTSSVTRWKIADADYMGLLHQLSEMAKKKVLLVYRQVKVPSSNSGRGLFLYCSLSTAGNQDTLASLLGLMLSIFIYGK